MSKDFIHSPRDTLAIDAMKLLKKNKITHMIITDNNKILSGALNIHDLLEAGIMR
jgi:predicted transcriptional regulator